MHMAIPSAFDLPSALANLPTASETKGSIASDTVLHIAMARANRQPGECALSRLGNGAEWPGGQRIPYRRSSKYQLGRGIPGLGNLVFTTTFERQKYVSK